MKKIYDSSDLGQINKLDDAVKNKDANPIIKTNDYIIVDGVKLPKRKHTTQAETGS